MPATVNLKSTNLGSLLNVVLDSLTPWAICHTVLIRGLTTVQRSQTVFDNMKYFFETWMFTLWRFRMISRYAHSTICSTVSWRLSFRRWRLVMVHCWIVRGDWRVEMRTILSSEFSRSLSVCTPSLNSLSILLTIDPFKCWIIYACYNSLLVWPPLCRHFASHQRFAQLGVYVLNDCHK